LFVRMKVNADGLLIIDAYTQRGEDPSAPKDVCEIDEIGIAMTEEDIVQAQQRTEMERHVED